MSRIAVLAAAAAVTFACATPAPRVSTDAAPPAPSNTENAYEVWTTDLGMRVTPQLGQALVVDFVFAEGAPIRVTQEHLEAALATRAQLEVYVGQLRRGLAAGRCVSVPRVPTDKARTLAAAGFALALVHLHEKQPVAPLLLDVLRMGQRIARCEGGEHFEFGQWTEAAALKAIHWTVSKSLLSADELARVQREVGTGLLTREEYARALEGEAESALSRLPPDVEGIKAYSRAETAALVRKAHAQVREALLSARGGTDAALSSFKESLGEVETEMISVDMLALIPAADWERALRRLERAPPNIIGRSLVAGLVEEHRVRVERLRQVRELVASIQKASLGPAMAWLESEEPALQEPSEDEPTPDLSEVQPTPKRYEMLGANPYRGEVQPTQKRCEKLGADRYRLEVPEDAALPSNESIARLLAPAAIVPVFAEGQAMGFKLFKIPRDSFLASCGFENSDILTTLNGFSLSSPESFLEGIAKVKEDRKAEVQVLRGEKRFTVTIVTDPGKH